MCIIIYQPGELLVIFHKRLVRSIYFLQCSSFLIPPRGFARYRQPLRWAPSSTLVNNVYTRSTADKNCVKQNNCGKTYLTHWGRVIHICVGKLTIIGSDNGLSPRRRQAIIWINAGILLIGPLGTKFSEIYIEILTVSFKKMRLKVSSAKWRPFCLGLNVLTTSAITVEAQLSPTSGHVYVRDRQLRVKTPALIVWKNHYITSTYFVTSLLFIDCIF